MKLLDLLKEVYPYRKGPSMVKNRMYDTTMDIDRMYKGARSYDEFEPRFRRKYKNYPNTPEAGQELRNLWTMYHDQELNEAEFLGKLKDLGKKALKALAGEGGDPVKVADLKPGDYRIYNKKWLAIVYYLGKEGDKHKFEIVDLYKDYEPMTGSAPKNGKVVKLSDQEVEDTVKTHRDAK